MRWKTIQLGLASAAILGAGLLASPAATQSGSGPVARYTMDAGTMAGMAAMGAQGKGGLGGALGMMRGGGGNVAHELLLKLGSSRAPTGAPKGDHFLPAGVKMGPSVPLVTPVQQPGTPGIPGGEMPRGRLLLFWGCGEHAGPGQPVVIDFAKLAKGQVPPDLFAAAVNIPEEWRVTPANSRTYGDWPNGTDGKQVPANASLLGAHKVTSSYSPDIGFTLDQDFMAPLEVRSSALASGAFAMNWNAVPGATGYYAWVMSAKDMGRKGNPDMVWWTSSASQAFGGPMWDWLSPAAVAKLVAAKTVMPASQTSCTVPAEVKQAGGEAMMANMYAYGPERDFSYPPRPPKVKVWSPEWIARVRFRSTSMTLLGMDMGAMGMPGSRSGQESSSSEPAPSTKPKCKGLKGVAMRAAGLCE
ncbi:MAG: hypothetical protein IE933_08570 [Sphingomonadales bacterium]|nr:hypothetical protein [Sphingomonadales bacterium]MBD3773604.1 hypothetical protein [Paracoccaceae bacterium]